MNAACGMTAGQELFSIPVPNGPPSVRFTFSASTLPVERYDCEVWVAGISWAEWLRREKVFKEFFSGGNV